MSQPYAGPEYAALLYDLDTVSVGYYRLDASLLYPAQSWLSTLLLEWSFLERTNDPVCYFDIPSWWEESYSLDL